MENYNNIDMSKMKTLNGLDDQKLLDEIISVIQSQDLLGDAPFKKPFKVDDCGWVSNRLAELLPISLIQKNHLLAQTNPRIRLDLISEIIEDDDLRNQMMH